MGSEPIGGNSDRAGVEWLDMTDVAVESSTGFKHIRKTNRATGVNWMCIESKGGRLLAEFTLGSGYPRVTLIKRTTPDGEELGRASFAGYEPPLAIEYVALVAAIEAGVKDGSFVRVSREGSVSWE
jgi:hypothetical protein